MQRNRRISKRHLPLLGGTRSKICVVFFKATASLFARLSLNIVREVCDYFSAPLLIVATYHSTVTVHDIESSKSKRRKVTREFSHFACFCRYSPRFMLCIDRNATFRLDLTSFALAAMPDKRYDMQSGGVIDFCGAVFMFGGFDGEKFDPSLERWRTLPAMTGYKSSLSPFVFRQEIYLCFWRPPNEAFNPVTEKYRRLPFSMDSELCSFVCFTVGDSIVMVTSHKEAIWANEDTGESVLRRAVSVNDPDMIVSNQPAVRCGQFAYWFSYERGLVKCDVKAGEVRRVLDVVADYTGFNN